MTEKRLNVDQFRDIEYKPLCFIIANEKGSLREDLTIRLFIDINVSTIQDIT